MTENSNNKLIPKLRFPGFTELWEQRKLGDIADSYSGGTPSVGVSSYYGGDIPFIRSAEINSNSTELFLTKDGLEKSSAKMVSKGYILYALYGATSGETGIAQLNGAINQAILAILPHSGYDAQFIMQWLRKSKASIIATYLQGGQGNLSGTIVNDLTLFVPLFEEQRKIGKYLEDFDNLITLHQHKLDDLKEYKNGMLQKMFPAKGSKKPEIRFPGFTEPWKQRNLGDLVAIERGGSPRPIDAYITDSPDGLNWVKIGDAPEQGRYITHTAERIKPSGLSKTRQVKPGDLILSNSMSFGKPYIMAISGCIHDGWLLIRNSQNIFDLKFLCQMLGTDQMLAQYKSLAAGSTVNNLNKDLVSSAVVTIPDKAEQEKIGKYFEEIDNIITLHQRKLDDLNELKKGLLQQMFVD